MEKKSCKTCKYVSNIITCAKTGGICSAYCEYHEIALKDDIPCSNYQEDSNYKKWLETL